MFKMTLLVSLRNFRRDSAYVLINLCGLVLGIACFLLLALFLQSQLSYDRHFNNYQNIYRVADRLHSEDGSVAHRSRTSRELAALLQKDYPDIIDVVRFSPIDRANLSAQMLAFGDDKQYWDNVYYADANVFSMFSHDIILGDPETALSAPSSIAINESVAKHYFGNDNPLGKRLETDFGSFQVTLVFKDLPNNTHFKYPALLSYHNFISNEPTLNYSRSLWFLNAFTYVKMTAPFDQQRIERMTWEIFDNYLAEGGKRIGKKRSFYFEPLADIHLNSIVGGDFPRGNKVALIACALLGVFVLLIACINSMNLAIARSIKRSNEVGLRKILGIGRWQLIGHFLGEATLFAFASLIIATLLVTSLIESGLVNPLIGGGLALNLLDPLTLLALLALGLILGLITGIYPALYLAKVTPKSALSASNRTGTGGKRGLIQQGLVMIQFTFSIAVISGALLMAGQIEFLREQPLGFNDSNLVLVKLRGGEMIRKIPTLKSDLLRDSRIVGAATTLKVPGVDTVPFFAVQVDDGNGTLQSHAVSSAYVDDDFLAMMDIRTAQGRPFDQNELEQERILINNTMAKRLGWTENAVNQRIVIGGNQDTRVMGVVEDFHFESLHQDIQSLIVRRMNIANASPQNSSVTATLMIRVNGERELASTLSFIRQRVQEVDPKHPVEMQLYSEALEAIYGDEQKLLNLVGIFSVLCVLISLMGLFGLSAFTTRQRTKEIGIRKILGATSPEIFSLLCKDLVLLILAASVFASALAYYAISQWLLNFAYRIEINIAVFLLTSAGAITLAFLTIILQGNNTVNRNPASSLR